MSLPEKNIAVSIEKERKLLKELNSVSTIFFLQAQKLTQVNFKKQSPDVIISFQVSVCVCVCLSVSVSVSVCENLGTLGWRVKKRVET